MENFPRACTLKKLCPTANCSVECLKRGEALENFAFQVCRETEELVCDMLMVKIHGCIEIYGDLSLHSFLWGLISEPISLKWNYYVFFSSFLVIHIYIQASPKTENFPG